MVLQLKNINQNHQSQTKSLFSKRHLPVTQPRRTPIHPIIVNLHRVPQTKGPLYLRKLVVDPAPLTESAQRHRATLTNNPLSPPGTSRSHLTVDAPTAIAERAGQSEDLDGLLVELGAGLALSRGRRRRGAHRAGAASQSTATAARGRGGGGCC